MDNQLLIKELYNAIAHSEPKRVKNILENYPCLLKIKTPIGSWLHVTAMHRNIDIVKYWVTSDIDINISGGICGSMPINFAVSEGHIEIVKYFLNKGAILDNSEPEKNPLFSAIHKGNLEIVKLIIENGIDINDNAISFAEEYGQREIANFLKNAIESSNTISFNKKCNQPEEYTIHDCIHNHLRQYFKKINKLSLMEILGDTMIHVIPSSPERNCIILVTSGATIRNENVKYEIIMYLPPDWDLYSLENYNFYWPIAWLRKIAIYEKKYHLKIFSLMKKYSSL